MPRDRLLANVSLYWFTGTAGSSANIYYESSHAREPPEPSGVPTGVAVFAEDMAIRRYGEKWHNIGTGATSTAAVILPRWRRRSCSSTTSGRSLRW